MININELPAEILKIILEFLEEKDNDSCHLVNKRFCEINYDVKTFIVEEFRQKTFFSYNSIVKMKLVGEQYDKMLFSNKIPKSLKHLTIDCYFNKSIYYLNFTSITHLVLSENFNQKIDNLPKTLTHLTLGDCFDKSVNKLPESLTHLIIGDSFNNSVDKLPELLTHLTLGRNFNNQSVDSLPKKLTHLTLGDYFGQTVDNLPESLTYLSLGSNFDQQVDHLPDGLKCLNLKRAYDFCHTIDSLPENLEELIIRESQKYLIDEKYLNHSRLKIICK